MEFQYALNKAIYDSTGFAPAKLCLRRQLSRLLKGLTFESQSHKKNKDMTDVQECHVHSLNACMKHSILILRKHLNVNRLIITEEEGRGPSK